MKKNLRFYSYFEVTNTHGENHDTPASINRFGHYRVKSMARFSLLGYYIIRCHSECVSFDQRPGQPSWFFDQPEKHRLGRSRCDLASCQVSLNSI